MDSAGYRIRVPCDPYRSGHLVLSYKQKKTDEVSHPSSSDMNSRKLPEMFHLSCFPFILCHVQGIFMFSCLGASFLGRNSNYFPIKSLLFTYTGSFLMVQKKENRISFKTAKIWLYCILMVTREGLRSAGETLF